MGKRNPWVSGRSPRMGNLLSGLFPEFQASSTPGEIDYALQTGGQGTLGDLMQSIRQKQENDYRMSALIARVRDAEAARQASAYQSIMSDRTRRRAQDIGEATAIRSDETARHGQDLTLKGHEKNIKAKSKREEMREFGRNTREQYKQAQENKRLDKELEAGKYKRKSKQIDPYKILFDYTGKYPFAQKINIVMNYETDNPDITALREAALMINDPKKRNEALNHAFNQMADPENQGTSFSYWVNGMRKVAKIHNSGQASQPEKKQSLLTGLLGKILGWGNTPNQENTKEEEQRYPTNQQEKQYNNMMRNLLRNGE